MLRFICLCSVLLLIGCSRSDWKEYVAPDGSFSVLLPKVPEERTMVVRNMAYGPMPVKEIMVEKDKLGFRLSWVDCPISSLSNAPATESLDYARDSVIKVVQGELLGEKYISLNGYAGRYIRIATVGGAATVVANIYLVNDRIYMLQVICSKEDAFRPEIQKYLDSFKLKSSH